MFACVHFRGFCVSVALVVDPSKVALFRGAKFSVEYWSLMDTVFGVSSVEWCMNLPARATFWGMERLTLDCPHCGERIDDMVADADSDLDIKHVAAWIRSGTLWAPDYAAGDLHARYMDWFRDTGQPPARMLSQRRLSSALLRAGWGFRVVRGLRRYMPAEGLPVDAPDPVAPSMVRPSNRAMVQAWLADDRPRGGLGRDLYAAFREWWAEAYQDAPEHWVPSQPAVSRALLLCGWESRRRELGVVYFPPGGDVPRASKPGRA